MSIPFRRNLRIFTEALGLSLGQLYTYLMTLGQLGERVVIVENRQGHVAAVYDGSPGLERILAYDDISVYPIYTSSYREPSI